MRPIEDLISTVEKYKPALLQKRFESKKNTVGYVVLNGQARILKWYVPGLKKNMDTEYSILKKGSLQLLMPLPLEKDTDNHVLVMSYIVGTNVCDIINDKKVSFEEKKQVVERLADWLGRFHATFKSEDGFCIRGDASLRNFILSKDHIYGVDFEEARAGKPVEDVAGMCASILSTDPMFTDEKFQLCQHFLDAYRRGVKWPLDNVNTEISYALLERIQWRPNDEELLRKIATKIRNKGLRAAGYNHQVFSLIIF
jgi:tRNA A-37 threonylcarbamoyl transferase component Bud32